MFVVDEFAPRGDRAPFPNPDTFADVEFTTAANEYSIADDDGGTGAPDAVELKENIRLENALASDFDLVRPGDGYFGDDGLLPDGCAAQAKPGRPNPEQNIKESEAEQAAAN